MAGNSGERVQFRPRDIAVVAQILSQLQVARPETNKTKKKKQTSPSRSPRSPDGVQSPLEERVNDIEEDVTDIKVRVERIDEYLRQKQNL